MCAFQLKMDLKIDFNQDLAQLKQANFDTIVQRLSKQYRPTQNEVLLHYQFHGLCQEPQEKIHSFIKVTRWQMLF